MEQQLHFYVQNQKTDSEEPAIHGIIKYEQIPLCVRIVVSEAYECLISAYQEAREINDELEELLKATLTN